MSVAEHQPPGKLTYYVRCTWSTKYMLLCSRVGAPLDLTRQAALCAILKSRALVSMWVWRGFRLFQLLLFLISALALLPFVPMQLQDIAPVSKPHPMLWYKGML